MRTALGSMIESPELELVEVHGRCKREAVKKLAAGIEGYQESIEAHAMATLWHLKCLLPYNCNACFPFQE